MTIDLKHATEDSIENPEEVSGALHNHHLVPAERRAVHKEIITRSLCDEPKASYPETLRLAERPLPITGSFLWMGDAAERAHRIESQAIFDEMSLMRRLGFDTLLVSVGVRYQVCFPCQTLNQPLRPDELGFVLKMAEEVGLRVFVAPPVMQLEWMIAPEKELAEIAALTGTVAREMQERYGHFSSFYGWYLPYELCNVFIQDRPNPRILPRWLGSLRDECKNACPEKPVVIAPYFTTVLDSGEFESLWSMVLEETRVDILAMQDGVGIYGLSRLKALDHHFSILQQIARRAGAELWADSEVFQQLSGIPLDEEEWSAVPAEMARIENQLRILSKYVSKVVIFCFSHYMSPEYSNRAARLFNEYRDYLEKIGGGQGNGQAQ